jgi:succinyl-CoA synthetase beta subunit
MFASQMIGHKLITKQTGARGRLCNAVYICERKFARREFYLAILMDRQSQGPVIVASSQGGMDIETVAKETPEAIITTNIDINKGVTDDIARNIATELGFSEQCIEDAKSTIQKLYKVFMEKDATQIEINPLSETSDHQVLAMDAKLNFDDNAEFRQTEVFSWRDTSQEDADEVKAAEYVVFPKLNSKELTFRIGRVSTSSSSTATSGVLSTVPVSQWLPWISSS